MKVNIKIMAPVLIFFGLACSSSASQTYVDGENVMYSAVTNSHGVVFKSKTKTVYLGKSCDAYSPQYGKGTWGWANGGVLIEFKTKKVSFPRQDSPFDDERCRI